MNNKLNAFAVVLLLSPILFIIMEFFAGNDKLAITASSWNSILHNNTIASAVCNK